MPTSTSTSMPCGCCGVRAANANASVVADEDSEVVVIQSAFLKTLMASHPGLISRFFAFLASYLADRLFTLTKKFAESEGGGGMLRRLATA